MKINRVYINEEDYPFRLKEISNPPNPLYYCGNLQLARRRCVAVVGSRRTTGYGRKHAQLLAEQLAAQGAVVVSGMAKGIDSCAHSGALKLSGSGDPGGTIAVLGCGVDVCYPVSNGILRDQIAARGLILSEYPPGTPPAKYRFPQRNRIISGLSEAVVVIQAPNSSGALITAELAAEQGRTVYAIPGNIDSACNLGSNKLIRDGAMPLVVLEDLFDDLRLGCKKDENLEKNLGKEEALLVAALKEQGEMTVDELCRTAGRTADFVSGMITILEIKGVVCTSSGKIFIAK